MFIIPPPKSYHFSYDNQPERNIEQTPPPSPQEDDHETDHIRNIVLGGSFALGGLAVFYTGISNPQSSYELLQGHVVVGSTIVGAAVFSMIESAIAWNQEQKK